MLRQDSQLSADEPDQARNQRQQQDRCHRQHGAVGEQACLTSATVARSPTDLGQAPSRTPGSPTRTTGQQSVAPDVVAREGIDRASVLMRPLPGTTLAIVSTTLKRCHPGSHEAPVRRSSNRSLSGYGSAA